MKISGNNRLARWVTFLSSSIFTIIHRKGIILTAADALSRPDREKTETDNGHDDDDKSDDELDTFFCACTDDGQRTDEQR